MFTNSFQLLQNVQTVSASHMRPPISKSLWGWKRAFAFALESEKGSKGKQHSKRTASETQTHSQWFQNWTWELSDHLTAGLLLLTYPVTAGRASSWPVPEDVLLQSLQLMQGICWESWKAAWLGWTGLGLAVGPPQIGLWKTGAAADRSQGNHSEVWST